MNNSSGSYSGRNYDRWAYEQAASNGSLADTPINRLQHKFWVAKQKVSKKLGKEEDQHIVASDSELDAKLELFKSINETTCRLQRLIERYQDRIYFLAGEENALGRFLKEEGKRDKTRAGKMMVAAGKTMSYTGQQRLAIRVPLVRLYQEVETFRLRAIEDMRFTVDTMEKVRTEYRGALLWMRNVSTELDPDTFRQLEKFRKVQIHVRDSKKRFDKLAVDCLQKIDLLAASRCNMFSHALIMYQNTLVIFWDKTAKTMNHVNNGFKGYQHYEFSYIKDLAEPSRELATSQRNKDKEQEEFNEELQGNLVDLEQKKTNSSSTSEKTRKDRAEEKNRRRIKNGSMQNLLDLSSQGLGSAPTLDDDDEILLRIDSELEQAAGQPVETSLGDIEKIFSESKLKRGSEDDDLLNLGPQSQDSLDSLLADGQSGTFTQEWEQHLFSQRKQSDGFSEFVSDRAGSSSRFLPSQLFDLESGTSDISLLDLTKPNPPVHPADPYSRLQQGQSNQIFQTGLGTAASATKTGSASSRDKDIAQWFSLFAELDPLSNPDNVGQRANKDCL
ncbi:islet cell autoantigen 1 isoform X2 [Eurytemora carolleeae]|uniref:islet cell autoantigen 1 isoform X2 n=1 Tax=Eurytemora carolleeae TaxID=1294199 RepID=UPI000C78B87A|nr:islet cell autoantigen 1 isoform X2 [Eurytemora carolleeae]|eukprot:XP_023322528.1 islet cell autoantigen 1-like isoform X2 [Eurytemora affinis]